MAPIKATVSKRLTMHLVLRASSSKCCKLLSKKLQVIGRLCGPLYWMTGVYTFSNTLYETMKNLFRCFLNYGYCRNTTDTKICIATRVN